MTISTKMRFEVLTEAGYRCAVPTCRTPVTVDIHHITEISQGGKDEKDNLIALCPTCHRLYHKKQIPREAVQVYKKMLVALNNAFDAQKVDDLIFLNKQRTGLTLLISGDGVLKFRRLIAAGLAEYHIAEEGPSLSDRRSYRVALSEKGIKLIEAWQAGNLKELEGSIDVL